MIFTSAFVVGINFYRVDYHPRTRTLYLRHPVNSSHPHMYGFKLVTSHLAPRRKSFDCFQMPEPEHTRLGNYFNTCLHFSTQLSRSCQDLLITSSLSGRYVIRRLTWIVLSFSRAVKGVCYVWLHQEAPFTQHLQLSHSSIDRWEWDGASIIRHS